MANKIHSIAYFVSHPIQYQAPLLKLLAEQPDIDLHVFFLADLTKQSYQDQGFNLTINWDTPLLDGYQYTFIDSTLRDADFSLFNPIVSIGSVKKALNSKHWDAIWIHGYNNFALLYIIGKTYTQKTPLFFRCDSTLTSSKPKFAKNIFIKSLIKASTALLWTSTENKQYYQYYAAKSRQLFFSPHAVDNTFFQRYRISPPNPLSDSKKCILLFASKFIARKKAPLLLTAFEQLKKSIQDKAELWFVGDGEDRALLEDAIKKYGLSDRVLLLGFKNQSEMPLVVAQCDVFILPSEKEPFGLVINEAMNLGKAIITTNEVGAAKDLVTHNDNGWVIPANDIAALKDALHEAIIDPLRLIKMGERSLSKINSWSYAQDIEGIRSALNTLPDRT